MHEDLQQLTEQWIIAFCEPPILLDAELMRRLLAERCPTDERDAR